MKLSSHTLRPIIRGVPQILNYIRGVPQILLPDTRGKILPPCLIYRRKQMKLAVGFYHNTSDMTSPLTVTKENKLIQGVLDKVCSTQKRSGQGDAHAVPKVSAA